MLETCACIIFDSISNMVQNHKCWEGCRSFPGIRPGVQYIVICNLVNCRIKYNRDYSQFGQDIVSKRLRYHFYKCMVKVGEYTIVLWIVTQVNCVTSPCTRDVNIDIWWDGFIFLLLQPSLPVLLHSQVLFTSSVSFFALHAVFSTPSIEPAALRAAPRMLCSQC